MEAMILAAGFGTRLQPYTFIRPKPLFPVLNQPILQYLLEMLREHGGYRPVVNCHYLGEQVQTFLEGHSGVEVQHEAEILGTGGSLRQALGHFSEQPVLVMNGDIFHDVNLGALYQHHLQSGNKVTMAMHACPRFNTVAVDNDRVVSFEAQPLSDFSRLAFTGIHVLNREVIAMIPEGRFFHIIDLYETLARRGEIGVFRVDGAYWRDIGTPQDYLQLHGDLLGGLAGKGLPRAARGKKWCLGESVRLGENVQLDDWGCLGAATIVGAGARLARCVVWDGVEIPPGAECQDSIITAETKF